MTILLHCSATINGENASSSRDGGREQFHFWLSYSPPFVLSVPFSYSLLSGIWYLLSVDAPWIDSISVFFSLTTTNHLLYCTLVLARVDYVTIFQQRSAPTSLIRDVSDTSSSKDEDCRYTSNATKWTPNAHRNPTEPLDVLPVPNLCEEEADTSWIIRERSIWKRWRFWSREQGLAARGRSHELGYEEGGWYLGWVREGRRWMEGVFFDTLCAHITLLKS